MILLICCYIFSLCLVGWLHWCVACVFAAMLIDGFWVWYSGFYGVGVLLFAWVLVVCVLWVLLSLDFVSLCF